MITGDRSGISADTRQAFANAGSAHILAISGLHLEIVAGFVFLVIRRGVCLFPALAVRVSSKKIAALVAFGLTAFYVLLCWQSIPARRAYLMITLVMGAILLDRSALSLRNVMFAATLLLLVLPESLLSPSFQLSFAAVIALIAAYESWQHVFANRRIEGKYGRDISVYFLSIVGTTLIATVATTPYTIFTFNQYTLHAVWADLLAIPITTFWIMPCEVISLFLLSVGLGHYIFPVLSKGIYLLKEIAFHVAGWPYAIINVAQGSTEALCSVTLGGLWICLWQKAWRWLGVFLVVIGEYCLLTPAKTDLYIDDEAKLVGVREKETLYLTSLRHSKFTAHLWQKHSGNLSIKSLSDHPSINCKNGHCVGEFLGKPIEIFLSLLFVTSYL